MTEGRDNEQGLYIALLSVHGLIKADDWELGRDPDTGGQIKYVVELTRALSERPDVRKVELFTRKVIDKKVDPIYQKDEEKINDKAAIIRIECGPRRYLRKETLWPHLDSFVDRALYYFRSIGSIPDIVHGHYADAGYTGSQIASILGCPFIFTGHSLGRDKKRRLLDQGAKPESIESQFRFTDRIEAEERALDTAAMVVASTNQEVETQYAAYDHYAPDRMEVIPPGVDLSRFKHEGDDPAQHPMAAEIHKFLHEPDKPMILCMARPDPRKNFETLVQAYAEDAELRELANLVLIAGNRDDLQELDKNSRKVLYNVFALIDKYDLYGQVAYPKQHQPDDVPYIYRLAAKTGGVFVNPALVEPFGLTLIEAAASGLPIVATDDGGPRDIIGACDNGLLVNALEAGEIAENIKRVLKDSEQWKQYAENGWKGAHKHFSWTSHAEHYLEEVNKVIARSRKGLESFSLQRSKLPSVDRIIMTDVDNTLTGDDEGLQELLRVLNEEGGDHVGFGIATGRSQESALQMLRDLGVDDPDIMINGVGTEIYYGKDLVPDISWHRHINYHWNPDELRNAVEEFGGLKLQDDSVQERFKLSYDVVDDDFSLTELKKHFRKKKLRVKTVYSLQAYIDLIPIRASGGLAIRYLMLKWGLAPDRLLVAGDSGNDEEMLSGNTLGVVVGNYSPELERLRNHPRIYFSEQYHARGILDGIRHYNFLHDIQIPGETDDTAH